MRRHSPKAFTLIELLVVISIIALLVAILLPALRTARTAAQMAASLSNIRQITIAQHAYANDFNGYVTFLTFGTSGGNHPVPNWASNFVSRNYLSSRSVLWGPGRNTSELDLTASFTTHALWRNVGYGMQNWSTAHEMNYLNPAFVHLTSSNMKYTVNLNQPRVPSHGRFLFMGERARGDLTDSTMSGFYLISAGSNTNPTATNAMFTYNGGSPHTYLDGHGSTDSSSIGWRPDTAMTGSWIYTAPSGRRVAPWYWEWWKN